jgi:hypothetical protein
MSIYSTFRTPAIIALPTNPFNYEEFLFSKILIPLATFFFYSSFARLEALIDFIYVLESP